MYILWISGVFIILGGFLLFFAFKHNETYGYIFQKDKNESVFMIVEETDNTMTAHITQRRIKGNSLLQEKEIFTGKKEGNVNTLVSKSDKNDVLILRKDGGDYFVKNLIANIKKNDFVFIKQNRGDYEDSFQNFEERIGENFEISDPSYYVYENTNSYLIAFLFHENDLKDNIKGKMITVYKNNFGTEQYIGMFNGKAKQNEIGIAVVGETNAKVNTTIYKKGNVLSIKDATGKTQNLKHVSEKEFYSIIDAFHGIKN